MAWLNLYQNIKQIIQDAIAPEIQSIKGEIQSIKGEIKGLSERMDSLEKHLSNEIHGLRTDLRLFEARTDKRFEEQSRQWELSMDVRERLASIEARLEHR